MKPYVIYTEAYRHNSGGIKVLHALCHYLNISGYEAYITTKASNPEYNTPFTDKVNNPIVIYPEVTKGNPLNSKRYIRYILNKPGEAIGSVDSIDEKEKNIYFSRVISGDKDYVLFIPTIETGLFYNTGEERFLYPYWTGKSKHKALLQDGIKIDGSFPLTRSALASIFKRSVYFTSYYPFTALITEATLCGCPVVIDNHSTFSNQEIEKVETGMDGIVFDKEDIEKAKEGVSKAYGNYVRIILDMPNKIKDFVDHTQSLF